MATSIGRQRRGPRRKSSQRDEPRARFTNLLEASWRHAHRAPRQLGRQFAKGDHVLRLPLNGVTWRAVLGDDPLKIMADVGHMNFQTTQGYIREVVVIRDGLASSFRDCPPRC
jgi:hypothetical protein